MKSIIKAVSFLLASCCIFSITACREKEKEPEYDCTTCQDEGIIDCPDCHIKDCSSCNLGIIRTSCWHCMSFCDYCDGSGIIMAGTLYLGDCTFCVNGIVYEDCSECQNNRYFIKACSNCVDGYIGGEKCLNPNCKISNYKNDGYSYIDCPDCEKNKE